MHWDCCCLASILGLYMAHTEFGEDLSEGAVGGCIVGSPVGCAGSVPEAVQYGLG